MHPVWLALALQQPAPAPDARPTPPSLIATRTSRAPTIDGRLDDPAWDAPPAATTFVQANPREGAPATEPTVVRIVYDDEALYVAARMTERDAGAVRAVLTRRDGDAPTDLFTIALDTYHDRQTAMVFSVNPLGVRADRLASGDQQAGDDGWDPVWSAAARIDDRGWTAEIRIPLSQLRFAPAAEQQWGVNLFRYSAARNETDVYALVHQNEQGFASRFATLDGIRGVPAPQRLELLPYARTQLASHGAQPGDPFFRGQRATESAGLDLKYGLTSNLIVDATVNPDFGQVEADPAQLNLTAFETQFAEHRPFFVEGAPIFAFGTAGGASLSPGQIFYSRRIGHAPTLSPDLAPATADGDSLVGPFVDAPASTPIRAAAKLSGKLAHGTSVGLLHAETGQVESRVDATQLFGSWRPLPGGDSTFVPDRAVNVRYRDPIEPRAHWTVARLTQDLRDGRTTVGVIGTQVIRDLSTPRLAAAFRHDARTLGADWLHRWASNRFRLTGNAAWSRVGGSRAAIGATQQSSAHYFQRPDQTYARYDSTRTSLDGWTANGKLRYDGPSGWGGSIVGNWTTPGYEINDLGFLSRADVRAFAGFVGYSTPRPSRHFQRVGAEASVLTGWDGGGERTQRDYGLNLVAILQSGWTAFLSVSRGARVYSGEATRGGPAVAAAPNRAASLTIISDARRLFSVSVSGSAYRTDFGSHVGDASAVVTWRPAANAELSVGPGWDETHDRGYLAAAPRDTLAVSTYGRRYVFGDLVQRTLSMVARANVTFTPALSLQVYAEPFTSGATVGAFRELLRPKSADFASYDDPAVAAVSRAANGDYTIARYDAGATTPLVIPDPDARFRSLRGNAVLRWEYRPGATLYAVWAQNRGAFDRGARYDGFADLRSLFALPLENVFLVKATLWISR